MKISPSAVEHWPEPGKIQSESSKVASYGCIHYFPKLIAFHPLQTIKDEAIWLNQKKERNGKFNATMSGFSRRKNVVLIVRRDLHYFCFFSYSYYVQSVLFYLYTALLAAFYPRARCLDPIKKYPKSKLNSDSCMLKCKGWAKGSEHWKFEVSLSSHLLFIVVVRLIENNVCCSNSGRSKRGRIVCSRRHRKSSLKHRERRRRP